MKLGYREGQLVPIISPRTRRKVERIMGNASSTGYCSWRDWAYSLGRETAKGSLHPCWETFSLKSMCSLNISSLLYLAVALPCDFHSPARIGVERAAGSDSHRPVSFLRPLCCVVHSRSFPAAGPRDSSFRAALDTLLRMRYLFIYCRLNRNANARPSGDAGRVPDETEARAVSTCSGLNFTFPPDWRGPCRLNVTVRHSLRCQRAKVAAK